MSFEITILTLNLDFVIKVLFLQTFFLFPVCPFFCLYICLYDTFLFVCLYLCLFVSHLFVKPRTSLLWTVCPCFNTKMFRGTKYNESAYLNLLCSKLLLNKYSFDSREFRRFC